MRLGTSDDTTILLESAVFLCRADNNHDPSTVEHVVGGWLMTQQVNIEMWDKTPSVWRKLLHSKSGIHAFAVLLTGLLHISHLLVNCYSCS